MILHQNEMQSEMSGVMMKDNSLREKPRQNNTKQGRMKR
jgi:hypothetical protein